MAKTLFLDFDGVLHCMAQTASRPFDRLELIEPLVDIAPFEIVISSSWRFHFELSEIKGRLGRLRQFVVGTTGDAATPLASTRKAAAALERGVLVIVEADRHTGYGLNTCVVDKVDSYLIDLAVPADETYCK